MNKDNTYIDMNMEEFMAEPQLPSIGTIYPFFDDGKITRSRMYEAKVIDIRRLSECPVEIHHLWQKKCEHRPWLGFHRFHNPHIIICTTNETEDGNVVYVAPAVNTDTADVKYMDNNQTPFWFGLGDWFGSGVLDVSRELYENLLEFELN